MGGFGRDVHANIEKCVPEKQTGTNLGVKWVELKAANKLMDLTAKVSDEFLCVLCKVEAEMVRLSFDVSIFSTERLPC